MSLQNQLKEKLNQDDDLVLRTVEGHNEYVTKLTKENEGKVKLSILIATTTDRRFTFNILCQEFNAQIEMAGYAGKGIERWKVKIPRVDENKMPVIINDKPVYDIAIARYQHKGPVEWIFEEDDKQMSIGAKRQKLLDRAKGKYIVFFDSDDFPDKNYVKEIMKALESGPDCVGFKIRMTTNGKNPETCIHSLSNPEWTHDGTNYLRNVTHFNPCKRDISIQVGFKDMRFGEDKVYSDAVSKLCKKEIFIDKYLFNYRYSNEIPHKEKYGIK